MMDEARLIGCDCFPRASSGNSWLTFVALSTIGSRLDRSAPEWWRWYR
jgi:hypothetical protein